jgi:hypothetical protein
LHIRSNLTGLVLTSRRKFGKQIQKSQLEIPEYAASFVDYKALKKVDAAMARLSSADITSSSKL